ncbi:unnamed protein product [Schistosoma turkestanicum]|nr:unnamed protein product [Schistosoma turkestanicum]
MSDVPSTPQPKSKQTSPEEACESSGAAFLADITAGQPPDSEKKHRSATLVSNPTASLVFEGCATTLRKTTFLAQQDVPKSNLEKNQSSSDFSIQGKALKSHQKAPSFECHQTQKPEMSSSSGDEMIKKEDADEQQPSNCSPEQFIRPVSLFSVNIRRHKMGSSNIYKQEDRSYLI